MSRMKLFYLVSLLLLSIPADVLILISLAVQLFESLPMVIMFFAFGFSIPFGSIYLLVGLVTSRVHGLLFSLVYFILFFAVIGQFLLQFFDTSKVAFFLISNYLLSLLLFDSLLREARREFR